MRLAMVLCLGLSACAAQQARDAATWAPGHTLADIESCMGVPDHQDAVVAEWRYQEPTSSSSLGIGAILANLASPFAMLSGGSTSISSAGSCRAIATLAGGRVTALRYAGDSDGLTGPNAVCAPLVRGCIQ